METHHTHSYVVHVTCTSSAHSTAEAEPRTYYWNVGPIPRQNIVTGKVIIFRRENIFGPAVGWESERIEIEVEGLT